MELLLSLCIGLGLSAACGYRVFVPLLGISIAASSGHVSLPEGFAWIGSEPALVAFAAATVLEIAAYYVPFVDNLLDTIATPAAVVAGTVVMSSFAADMNPFLKWSLAIIAGGGTAGFFQGATVLTRSTSTAVTAGMGNFLVSSTETAISAALTLLALFAPLLAAVSVVVLLVLLVKKVRRKGRSGNLCC